jgi:hypothetical protein
MAGRRRGTVMTTTSRSYVVSTVSHRSWALTKIVLFPSLFKKERLELTGAYALLWVLAGSKAHGKGWRKACASVAFFWTLCNCRCSDRCISYVRWMDNTISTYERPRTKNNNIGKEVESSRATQGDRLGKNLKILLRSNFSLNMSICPICST